MVQQKVDAKRIDRNSNGKTAIPGSSITHCEVIRQKPVHPSYDWQEAGIETDPFPGKDSFPHCLYYLHQEKGNA
jgi:hypothetical protein